MNAYKNYGNVHHSYDGEKQPPLLDYAVFRTHCLFKIDFSIRQDSMKFSTVGVKLNIEAKAYKTDVIL